MLTLLFVVLLFDLLVHLINFGCIMRPADPWEKVDYIFCSFLHHKLQFVVSFTVILILDEGKKQLSRMKERRDIDDL